MHALPDGILVETTLLLFQVSTGIIKFKSEAKQHYQPFDL